MTIFHAVVIGLLILIPWSLVGVNLVGAAVATMGRKLAPIRKKSRQHHRHIPSVCGPVQDHSHSSL